MICDFCLGPNPRWEYPAAPMEIAGGIFDATDDEWAACDQCHRLIEIKDIIGLADRVVREQPRNQPPGSVKDGGVVVYPHASVRRAAAMHNVLRFMDARKGPPVRM